MLKNLSRTSQTGGEKPEEDETKGCVFLPYAGPPTAKIGRILKKQKLKTVFYAARKIKDILGSTKDPLGLMTPGVYRIGCECGMQYIGQTERCISQRCKEHIRNVRLGQVDKSAVAEHSVNEGHTFQFEETKKLCNASGFWDSVIKEAIEIRLHDDLVNRDSGFNLSTAWDPAINKMRQERSGAKGNTVMNKQQYPKPTRAPSPPPAAPGAMCDSDSA